MPERVLHAKPWSEEDEQQLPKLMRETAMTQFEIARKLGRTEAAVSNRLTVIRKRKQVFGAQSSRRTTGK
ncbi:hypothetical protein [Bradyrhizobium australafricanum]|uniref:hypothetical protein n=1 Tax=Bradyrhizobium australafricanum TaxID=2821406 RepID=UPI0040627DF8